MQEAVHGNNVQVRDPPVTKYIVCIHLIDEVPNFVRDLAVANEVRPVPLGFVHGWVHRLLVLAFLNLPLDRAERFLIDIAGLELVRVVGTVVIDGDDVLALFHRAVRRNVQDSLSFSQENLAVRDLVVALVGLSQPVRDDALDHSRDEPVVVKAAGLAKGKGVIVCDEPSDGILAAEKIMVDRIFGSAGDKVVVEDKLIGEEASRYWRLSMAGRFSTPAILKTMRLCATGAEKAPPELFKQVEELGKGGTIVEGYGITECSPVLTFNRVGKTQKVSANPCRMSNFAWSIRKRLNPFLPARKA